MNNESPAPKDKGVKPTTYTDDDFKYYTDTIVRIMKNAICKKGSTPNDAIDELNSFFASAMKDAKAMIIKAVNEMAHFKVKAEFLESALKELQESYEVEKERAEVFIHKSNQFLENIQALESALKAKEEELEKIQSENANYFMLNSKYAYINDQLEKKIDALESKLKDKDAEIERLRDRAKKLAEALKPFANNYSRYGTNFNTTHAMGAKAVELTYGEDK